MAMLNNQRLIDLDTLPILDTLQKKQNSLLVNVDIPIN